MRKFIYCLTLVFLLAFQVCAQTYSIDTFTIAGGSGTVSGGPYTISGTVGQPDGNLGLSGGAFSMEGGFWAVVDGVLVSTTIFDNTGGTENGGEAASTNAWLANKLCVGATAYQLDSVSLLLNNQDSNGQPGPPSTVRLQIYANDSASGKPSASTGLTMSLSGLTNPITLVGGQQLVMWTPDTPLTLAANSCYWVVLSTDAGIIGEIDSFTVPTGDASALGRSVSGDAGGTWSTPDTASNRKMLIQGTALAPDLRITSVQTIGQDLHLGFMSVAGKNYVLQSSADLSSGTWTTLPGPPTSGVGGPVEVTLPSAFGWPQQFYRLKIVP
jgi:hypothetical protein